MPVALTRPIATSYGWDPMTGTTVTRAGTEYNRTGTPPRQASPGLFPPTDKPLSVRGGFLNVRDPTNPTTYPQTGGTPISLPFGFRSLQRR